MFAADFPFESTEEAAAFIDNVPLAPHGARGGVLRQHREASRVGQELKDAAGPREAGRNTETRMGEE